MDLAIKLIFALGVGEKFKSPLSLNISFWPYNKRAASLGSRLSKRPGIETLSFAIKSERVYLSPFSSNTSKIKNLSLIGVNDFILLFKAVEKFSAEEMVIWLEEGMISESVFEVRVGVAVGVNVGITAIFSSLIIKYQIPAKTTLIPKIRIIIFKIGEDFFGLDISVKGAAGFCISNDLVLFP